MDKCQSSGCSCGDSELKPIEPKQPERTQADIEAEVKNALTRIKNKFMVMSGKGGVGKTSVSVNLAMALADKGYKVGIMDVDIHGPDIPRMLGIQGMMDVNEKRKLVPMKYSDNLKAVSVEAICTNRDDAIIWRGPLKHSAIRQFVADVDWGNLDFLIIDSPPGTGDEPLSVAQIVPGAQAVIVTTPQEISLADVRKSINFCKTVNLEITGLVENMSGFVCPHCHESVDIFGVGGGEKTAKDFDLNFLGRIPLDPQMVVASDAGESYQAKHPDSSVTKSFHEIADQLVEASEGLEDVKPAESGNGSETIKFAIPLAEGKLTAHFGHCQQFALVNVEKNEIKNLEFLVPPPHEPGVLPKWLGDMGTNIIIAGGMGHRALDLFNQNGIKVVTGAPSQAPEELVMSYLNNSLVTGANVCDH